MKPVKNRLLGTTLKVLVMGTASLLALLVGGFFVFIMAAGETAGYKQKVEACLKAREPGGAGAKSITDYVCPEGRVDSQHDIAYQVVLDLAFRKLDKELTEELKAFQGQKVKQSTDVNTKLVDWFDETGVNADKSYTARYKQICKDLGNENNPVGAVVKAFTGVTTDGTTGEFLYGENSCTQLVDQKKAAYRDIAYLIGIKNASDTIVEDKARFVDKLNDNYQNFLMQWTIYVGELSRIKSKWNIKTKTQNGS